MENRLKTFQKIGDQYQAFRPLSPYIIAEIGVNHEGDMARAKAMIEQVARGGGHAAKFQTYKADKIASKDHSPYYWDLKAEPSTSQHALFTKYDKFWSAEYAELAAYCKKCGVDFLSTPFDLDAVDMLDPHMHYFKVASADVTNIPLLRRIGSKKKPVLMSNGAATLAETEMALQVLTEAGATDLALMHCVLNYPTPKDHAQLGLIETIRRVFGDRCAIGYSDHVAPDRDGAMPALDFAVLRGCVVIEKHFTYDKTLPGNDHYHAMDESDLRKFVERLKVYRELNGAGQREISWEAKAVSHARRRIMAAKPVRTGETLSEDKLIALRSEIGIEVIHWDDVVGRKALKDFSEGDAIEWKAVA
jgi:N-acetylneuraminate synthase